jgi:chromosome segregation ATPase
MAAGASEWRAAAREAVARAMQTQPQGEAAIEAVLAALAPLQAETDAARKEAQDMGAALLEAHSQLKRATVKVERLEGLCRELQKKNKTLGDQHERVVQQEEAHRKLSASIADISQRVEAAQTERARQEAENTKSVAREREVRRRERARC